MEGNLVIVESPAKAKTIQKYLGKGFIVKSSFGHIRDLPDRKLSIDVEHGFAPEYVVPEDKKKVVAELGKLSREASVVWLASDEDREGEAISWHLSQTLGLDPSRTKRIAFHEITKPAILEAINNPRDIDMNLVNAQQARRVLDRIVGFELSPILWRKIGRGLSAGRVQSVALRLVVDREREILAFKKEASYRVSADFRTDAGTVSGTLDTRFQNLEEARKFLEDSVGKVYTVSDILQKESSRFPAPPFTTSTLQQEAARKLHFSVSQTMRVAQSLYERGLITYMRTDSTNLSSLAVGAAKQFISDNFGQEYLHSMQYKTRTKGAQEAHEAIRPTFINNTSVEGTPQEQKLYELIWKRTVASQMARAELMNTTVKISIEGRPEQYCIEAYKVLFDGFLKLYTESTDDEGEETNGRQVIPDLKAGDILDAEEVRAECKFTRPPFRYSEASLVKKLEELGIGRPSTYAPTISTLTTGRGYLVKGNKEGSREEVTNLSLRGGNVSEVRKFEVVGEEKGKLLPQEVGIIVTDYLTGNFSEIMDYDFTANVEKDFDEVAEGRKEWNSLISEFYGPFHGRVEESLHDGQYNHVSRELGTAPDGDVLVAKFGQYGAYVQKGDASKKQFASLGEGQLIENITFEEALKLFELPRRLGEYKGEEITILKGRFGPYIRYGSSNVSIPRGKDPLKITLEEAVSLIDSAGEKKNTVIAEFGDIQVLAGQYGPYIKSAGTNYKIPKGTDASSLTEEDCRKIMADEASVTKKRFKRRYSKTK